MRRTRSCALSSRCGRRTTSTKTPSSSPRCTPPRRRLEVVQQQRIRAPVAAHEGSRPDVFIMSLSSEFREYITPEIVDAYLSVHRQVLEAWCGEAISVSTG
ncbi:hypothetical protein BKA93DRAFT_807610 [Sparassis latifolia]